MIGFTHHTLNLYTIGYPYFVTITWLCVVQISWFVLFLLFKNKVTL